jgi:hypothetical protein
MNKPVFTCIALALATVIGAGSLHADDTQAEPAEARALVKQFAATLQGALKGAIADGGPIAAVQVCKEQAPAIAADLSAQSPWEIGRTSLKPRNGALNAPDDWERKTLEQFESRVRNGEAAMGMTYAEIIATGEGKTYRHMQAIPTGEVCLACHGENVAPALADAIDAAYPEDMARGYKLGDIRGAFTLSKPM